MGTLPTGTVTFLFTDIEGSTKLARQHADQWENLRARHHAILQVAIKENNGYIFQIIGDAFCATFNKSGEALDAAIKAQQGLQNEAWGDVAIRVRMGIHTGEAELQEDGQYQGYIALSLVQRIMSAGNGGQVLISGATENLLRGQLPKGVDLLDMGRHNFKDVPHAVRVFQANAPDLLRDFPPLRTFDILPNNLPTQLTSFVGRERELTDVKKLLHETHLLTLIGPGGTGKTRLALEVAGGLLDQYPDGVWLVELARILDPALVPRTTAIAIGLRDEPKRPVIDMLCDYLQRKKMLIILDNCEHLVDACAQMADRILHAASGLRVLASSREALGIAGEVTYRVPSLGLPDMEHLPALESLSQYEAVKLFIDRATSAIPDFKVTNENAPALAQICHRLDGIPLAIELAAAKTHVLGVEQIAKRLDDRFRLLTGGSRTALERHQTLRAAVDWSYNLLLEGEQVLFRRLAVFVGGWTLEAAESVCANETGANVLDRLEQLINKSLIITEEEHGVSRYHMLETIRQYANEKLVESGESESVRDEHLGFFLELAETAAPYLIRPEQLKWLAKLDSDYENLRVALELALDKDSAEASLRMCAALGKFWVMRSYWIEGSRWLAKALAKPVDVQNDAERTARVEALYQDAELAEKLDNIERMRKSAELSLALAQKDGNVRNVAIAKFYVGFSMRRQNEWESGRELMEQSQMKFDTLNDPFWKAYSYYELNGVLRTLGESELDESGLQTVDLARKVGERLLLADTLIGYAEKLYLSNRLDESLKYTQEADMLYKQVGSDHNPTSFRLAFIAWLNKDYKQATSLFAELQERLGTLGEKFTRNALSGYLGELELEQDNLDQARIYFEQGLERARELQNPWAIAIFLGASGSLFYLNGDIKKFKQQVIEGISIVKTLPRTIKKKFLFHVLNSIHTYKPTHSTYILGALHNYERNSQPPISPWDKHGYDRAEAHVRDVLSSTTFESVFAEGQKMSLDDGLDLVLKIAEEIE
jgi:predicted ATPase/class 3 adenylate cyclase